MAGRPKKVQENTVNETKIQKEKVTKKENTNDIEKENQDLKAEIEKMKIMLEQLTSNLNISAQKNVSENNIINTISEEVFEDVRPDKQIPVMSLENNSMHLTTLPKGQGKQFPFYKFGQVRNINYSDLSDLILNHQQFAEDGRFYILDRNAIHKQGLDDTYKNLLNKEQMTDILNYKKDEIEKLFTNTSKAQQETIASLLVERVYKGEELDLNKINLISKLFGKDIMEMANSLSFNFGEQ